MGIEVLGRAGQLASLLLSTALISGCGGTVPYTTAPGYETTLIPGTETWAVWISQESVQRLDVYVAQNPGPTQPGQSPTEEGFLIPDDFVAVQELPHAISEVAPRYPQTTAGLVATIWITALVLKDGSVGAAKVVRNSGTNFGIERAALEAAMQYRYSPALQNGDNVAMWVQYAIEYRSDIL